LPLLPRRRRELRRQAREGSDREPPVGQGFLPRLPRAGAHSRDEAGAGGPETGDAMNEDEVIAGKAKRALRIAGVAPVIARVSATILLIKETAYTFVAFMFL